MMKDVQSLTYEKLRSVNYYDSKYEFQTKYYDKIIFRGFPGMIAITENKKTHKIKVGDKLLIGQIKEFSNELFTVNEYSKGSYNFYEMLSDEDYINKLENDRDRFLDALQTECRELEKLKEEMNTHSSLPQYSRLPQNSREKFLIDNKDKKLIKAEQNWANQQMFKIEGVQGLFGVTCYDSEYDPIREIIKTGTSIENIFKGRKLNRVIKNELTKSWFDKEKLEEMKPYFKLIFSEESRLYEIERSELRSKRDKIQRKNHKSDYIENDDYRSDWSNEDMWDHIQNE